MKAKALTKEVMVASAVSRLHGGTQAALANIANIESAASRLPGFYVPSEVADRLHEASVALVRAMQAMSEIRYVGTAAPAEKTRAA